LVRGEEREWIANGLQQDVGRRYLIVVSVLAPRRKRGRGWRRKESGRVRQAERGGGHKGKQAREKGEREGGHIGRAVSGRLDEALDERGGIGSEDRFCA
jgi:hypothetical protein